MQAVLIGKTKNRSIPQLFLKNRQTRAEEDIFGASRPYQFLATANSKVLYFGVGGRVMAFLESIERRKASP